MKNVALIDDSLKKGIAGQKGAVECPKQMW